MALAFFISLSLIEREARLRKLDASKITNLCLLIFIFGLLGARVMYVLANMPYYKDNLFEIILLHHGGLMFHGGFITGLLASWLYLKKTKLPLWPVLDILAQFLPLGQAIGRIGCFLNGCCFGREADLPWAMTFPSEDVTRHPTQLYEALGSLVIFVILRRISRRSSIAPARIFSLYLILYPLNRIIVEIFRQDLPKVWLGLSFTQWLSIMIFIAGIIILSRPYQKN
jgi:phosphatidylglycerol:prolipoprotein diacylglycerol transferase